MFGNQTDFNDSCAIVDKAIDSGINLIDTANSYHRGKCEETVGQALQRNGKRDRIILATKVHGTMDPDDPNQQSITRRHIIEQCEASLSRLKTDHIDLYQLHRPRSEVAIDESLRALDDLIRSGKVRYIGTSVFTSWKIVESLWASKELGLNRFVSEQPPYNILDRRIENELIPMAQTFSIALMPYSPLAGGMLSGKYKDNNNLSQDTRYGKNIASWNVKRLSDPIIDKAQQVVEYAKEKGVDPIAFATAWVMNQPGITSPIVGPRTMAHLDTYLKTLDIEITVEDKAAIDQIIAPGEHISPFYQANFADFGPNLHRW